MGVGGPGGDYGPSPSAGRGGRSDGLRPGPGRGWFKLRAGQRGHDKGGEFTIKP